MSAAAIVGIGGPELVSFKGEVPLIQARVPQSSDLSGATIKPFTGGSTCPWIRLLPVDAVDGGGECGGDLSNLGGVEGEIQSGAEDLNGKDSFRFLPGSVLDGEPDAVNAVAEGVGHAEIVDGGEQLDRGGHGCAGGDEKPEGVAIIDGVERDLSAQEIDGRAGGVGGEFQKHHQSPVGCVAVPTVAEGEGQCTLPGGRDDD